MITLNPHEHHCQVIAIVGYPQTGKKTIIHYLSSLHPQDQFIPFHVTPDNYKNIAKMISSFHCHQIVIVCYAGQFKRDLKLFTHIHPYFQNIIVCLNFMDQAYLQQIDIPLYPLAQFLQVPLITTIAHQHKGLSLLEFCLYHRKRPTIEKSQ